jgi:hypothetical protein
MRGWPGEFVSKKLKIGGRKPKKGEKWPVGRCLATVVFCATTGTAIIAIATSSAPAAQRPQTRAVRLAGDSGPEKHHDKSPPLRTIPNSHTPGKAHPARPVPGGPSQHSGTVTKNTGGGPARFAPTASANFDGIGANGSAPPDNDVAAGPSQVVELVNSELAVYSKTGSVLLSPRATNTLWSGFGGGCQTNNDGDGTVLFDRISQRWVIQQFSVSTTPSLDCVAVSTSSDATGTYNRYSFQLSNFPDYPKMGVWPDAYYASYNQFQGNTFVGAEMCAFDRAAMVAGTASSKQCFTPSSAQTSVLPATLDGTTQPPSGEPEWFVGISPTQANSLAYWQFHVDWTTPANSTLTGPTNLAVNAFSEACGGGTCIPQTGTKQKLDSLGDRLMFRLAYRNFGDHEALVVSHAVTAGTSVGMRWYELRPSGSSLSVFQQGTYAPNSTFRWMGSVAMDQSGDMALGYSTSSSSLHPGVAFTGRLASDTAGTMPQGETTYFTGAGSQTGGLSRWGDYSEMSVDPSDDCTFWYVNEYLPANGSFNWHTRIGSFSFPSCGGSSGVALTATPSSVGLGGTVTVSWGGVSNPTNTDWIGVYPAGAGNDPASIDNERLSWVYDDSCTQSHGTNALASGSCSIAMPTTAGNYEVRLFYNNGYTILATSNQITVAGGSTATISAPSSACASCNVTVSWSGVSNPTNTDWIGVYPAGAGSDPASIDNERLGWVYDDSCTQIPGTTTLASGSCSVTMPSTAGSYEVRLFYSNGYTILGTSNQITVG